MFPGHPGLRVVLASSSPRRLALLQAAGATCLVAPAGVDETPRPGEEPTSYARRIATTKLLAALEQSLDVPAQDPWLAADTVVWLERDAVPIGKPKDVDDARRMVFGLTRGEPHLVTTAWAIGNRDRGPFVHEETTRVFMRRLAHAEIDAYLRGTSWRDKAGAYGIQDDATSWVTRIEGSYSNVVGAPRGAGDRGARGVDEVNEVPDRLARILDRVRAATQRRGDGPPVRLIGVSKRQPLSAVRAAAEAGLEDFGENYAQELRDKRVELADPVTRWHFIGRLQRNKAKLVVGCALVHTVDRPALAQALDKAAAAADLVQDVLLQVNIAGEQSKGGVAPGGLPPLLDALGEARHLRVRGLMTIPPLGTPEQTRPHYAALARLARAHGLPELSMGMSSDFEIAIEEGATLVRIGTAIFGPRPAA